MQRIREIDEILACTKVRVEFCISAWCALHLLVISDAQYPVCQLRQKALTHHDSSMTPGHLGCWPLRG